MTTNKLRNMTDSELKARRAVLERKIRSTGDTVSILDVLKAHEDRELRAALRAKTTQERKLHEQKAARARTGRRIVESWDKRGKEFL